MKIVHQCTSTVGWQPVRIQSSSSEHHYLVHVNPWGRADENLCECRGYLFRGECKHQRMASAKLCGWREEVGPEEQIPEYRRLGICPRCHQATHRTVLEDE